MSQWASQPGEVVLPSVGADLASRPGTASSCNPGAFTVIFWVEMHCGPKNTDQVKFSILWGSSNFKYMLRIHQSSSISRIVLYFSLYTLMAAQFFARPWLLLQSSAFFRSYIRSWERNRPRLWLVVACARSHSQGRRHIDRFHGTTSGFQIEHSWAGEKVVRLSVWLRNSRSLYGCTKAVFKFCCQKRHGG